jgi:ABC-type Fe3+ transport system permease subunit
MKKLFGGLLMGCGILIAGLSGLCVLIAAGMSVTSLATPGGGGEFFSIMLMVVFIAAAPIAIGVGLFFLGRHLIRQGDAERVDLEKNNPFE